LAAWLWRTRLKEPDKYRAMLFGSAYTKAMAQDSDKAGVTLTLQLRK